MDQDRLAELTEEYHAVLDQVRAAPDDAALRERKAQLAAEIVAVRTEQREQREAETAALSDGVARPAPVEGKSGVNE